MLIQFRIRCLSHVLSIRVVSLGFFHISLFKFSIISFPERLGLTTSSQTRYKGKAPFALTFDLERLEELVNILVD
ncbi:hypothetical protein QWA68_011310 [Fusarium oxysporum]|nr:hypothetical protein QWA68_011310 [Fusarium oxysporum]